MDEGPTVDRTPDRRPVTPGGFDLDRLADLERVARRLEPGPVERSRVLGPALEYADDFLDSLDGAKAYEVETASAERVRRTPFSEEPGDVERLLDIVRTSVDTPGLNPASPGHTGYIPGGGVWASAVADYLADVTNRYAGIRFASPGAVAMEEACLEWMAEVVGYPAGAGGNLASGGSIANLIAIVTAREARGVKAADVPRTVVYLSGQTHHCVDKALGIAGLRECVVRRVPMDDRYRMRADELERVVEEDRGRGLEPWLVVASVGSTDVGAIDPLDAVADVADANGLWLHLDAAYGGFFALVDELRPTLAPMSRSDSIVLDPHKGLFLPYGTGAVLVKDVDAMAAAHGYQAKYMQDAKAAGPAPSPAELSPELTKHFRGLRTWLPLQLHGLAPFRACLEEKLILTRYFHRRVEALGFEVGPDPELSVSTYRWVPDGASLDEANAFNAELIREIHRDGRVFISSTDLEGRFTLRMAALTFRTHREHVDLLLEVLEEKVERLAGEGPGRRR